MTPAVMPGAMAGFFLMTIFSEATSKENDVTDAPSPTPLAPPLSKLRRAGPFVFVSGQLPRQADGAMLAGGIEAQTRQAILNLEAALKTEGLGLGHVIKTTVWLTHAGHAPGFNAVYRTMFPQPYPARSTVISGLVADADIEIEAVAALP